MTRGARWIASAALLALLAGCAGGGNRPSNKALQRIDRALERAPGKAQPSKIVKADLAFKRAARENGQKSAFLAFAAPSAQIHTQDGVVDAASYLARQSNPDQAAQWETKSVWMSCDGSVAIAQGRLQEADGTVGNYVTVWERQRSIRVSDEEETGYRYVYFASVPDDPQPPPRKEIIDGEIVVEAIDAVRADIATCTPRSEIDLTPLTAPPLVPGTPKEDRSARLSRDATLFWVRSQAGEGQRQLSVSLWRKAGWETAFTQDLP